MLKTSWHVAAASARSNSLLRPTNPNATRLFVTVVPTLAPITMMIAESMGRPPPGTAANVTTIDVEIDELCMIDVAKMPTARATTGLVTAAKMPVAMSAPSPWKAADIARNPTRKANNSKMAPSARAARWPETLRTRLAPVRTEARTAGVMRPQTLVGHCDKSVTQGLRNASNSAGSRFVRYRQLASWCQSFSSEPRPLANSASRHSLGHVPRFDQLTVWILAGVLLLQLFVSVRVWRSRLYRPAERRAQLRLIWLVPLFGASLSLAMLASDRNHPPRDDSPYQA